MFKPPEASNPQVKHWPLPPTTQDWACCVYSLLRHRVAGLLLRNHNNTPMAWSVHGLCCAKHTINLHSSFRYLHRTPLLLYNPGWSGIEFNGPCWKLLALTSLWDRRSSPRLLRAALTVRRIARPVGFLDVVWSIFSPQTYAMRRSQDSNSCHRFQRTMWDDLGI